MDKLVRALRNPIAAILLVVLEACSGNLPTTMSAQSLNQSQSGARTNSTVKANSSNRQRHRPSTAYDYAVVSNFQGSGSNPDYPEGGLTYENGAFYGTTQGAWSTSAGGVLPTSTVFKVVPGGAPQAIYKFSTADWVVGGVAFDANGAIYGVSEYGPGSGCSSGTNYCCCGYVFQLQLTGGSWTKSILHAFTGGADGKYPSAPLLLRYGILYGTTQNGGTVNSRCPTGCGTIYQISTAASGFSTMHRFSGSDGIEPTAGLFANNSVLYGTAQYGGSGGCTVSYYGYTGCGTIYSIKPAGTNFTLMHNFTGIANGDGAAPASVFTYYNGVLYGTTGAGGGYNCPSSSSYPAGCGTIFKILPSGSGEGVIHEFESACPSGCEGPNPSSLAVDANGYLFGTTSWGGTGCPYDAPPFYAECGRIFRYNTTAGTYVVLHFFGGPPSDGASPYFSPLGSEAGAIVGRTNMEKVRAFAGGGSGVASAAGAPSILRSAKKGAVDSYAPLYGVTNYGGNGGCSGWGCGTVYAIDSTAP